MLQLPIEHCDANAYLGPAECRTEERVAVKRTQVI